MSDICCFPPSLVRERSRAAGPARAERERRVVECLKGGLAMAEIARREGITECGIRKSVRNLIARRAPEATGEFIAVQMNRLNEALVVSFGALSGENLAAVDRWSGSCASATSITGSGAARAEPKRAASFWKVSFPEPKRRPLPSPTRVARSGRRARKRTRPRTGPSFSPTLYRKERRNAEQGVCATHWKASIREPRRRPPLLTFVAQADNPP